MSQIKLEDVYFSYRETPEGVLSGLNLEIRAGSFVTVIGSNGSGKSTLLKLLNGLILPDRGEVKIDGLSTKDRKNLRAIREKVSLLFQNPDNQIVGDTLELDTAFGPENLGLESEEIGRRVEKALDRVGLLDKRHLSPQALSGGEKARLGIAGVLALESSVMALDEATAMLDGEGRERVLEILLKECRENGRTIILVTHHSAETLLSDRVIVLDKGRIILDGTPKEVYREAKLLKEKGIPIPPYAELSLLLDKGEIALTGDELWHMVGGKNG